MGRVVSEGEIVRLREEAAREGRRFVFTNGCFDVIHAGHLHVLREAKGAGDLLLVAVNGDDSVRRLKGEGRPLVGEEDRAELIAALEPVDFVVLFHEETPGRIIDLLKPDVLVKGGDYGPNEIVGAGTVRAAGGEVLVIPLKEGLSTRSLIARILERYGNRPD
ncbi:MAG: D-glycero-beta-D-manno-heptose 1-phosphate adenylyltransferase [Candidatus Eisenbacteria bacterium]